MAACNIRLKGSEAHPLLVSRKEYYDWLTGSAAGLCMFGGTGGDRKGRAQSVSKYFQLWPKVECMLGQQLNVFFLGWYIGVGGPVKIFPHIAGINCEWTKGFPDFVRIRVCQGKTRKNSCFTPQVTFMAKGHFFLLEELTIGGLCDGFLSSAHAPLYACRGGPSKVIVCVAGSWQGALWGSLDGGLYSSLSCRKDSVLDVWSGLTGGQDASREQGLEDEACEDLRGRGLEWGKETENEVKRTHWKAGQPAFSPLRAVSLGRNGRMEKVESEKIIKTGNCSEERPPSSEPDSGFITGLPCCAPFPLERGSQKQTSHRKRNNA